MLSLVCVWVLMGYFSKLYQSLEVQIVDAYKVLDKQSAVDLRCDMAMEQWLAEVARGPLRCLPPRSDHSQSNALRHQAPNSLCTLIRYLDLVEEDLPCG